MARAEVCSKTAGHSRHCQRRLITEVTVQPLSMMQRKSRPDSGRHIVGCLPRSMLAGQSVTLFQPIAQPLRFFAKRRTRRACVCTHDWSILARKDSLFAILLAVAIGNEQGSMKVAVGEYALGYNFSRIVDVRSIVQIQVRRVF